MHNLPVDELKHRLKPFHTARHHLVTDETVRER